MFKLSVIIPVYNVEDYLDRCISSIINQSKNNFELEILLINDGSTDNSSEICKKYFNKYDFVCYFDKSNGGLSDARNYGIKHCSGDYIMFVDSDDYLIDGVFESFNIALQINKEIDVFQFGHKKVFNDCITNKNFETNGNYFFMDNQTAYLKYLQGRCITRMAWGKIYRKYLFENVEFPFGFLAEDYGTTYKILAKSNVICVTSNEYYAYYQRRNSIMGNKALKLIEDEYKLGCEFFEFSKLQYNHLKKYVNTEHINLLIKTYVRSLRYGKSKIECKFYRAKAQKLLFLKTQSKTKIAQLIFVAFPKLAKIMIDKKDSKDWDKI